MIIIKGQDGRIGEYVGLYQESERITATDLTCRGEDMFTLGYYESKERAKEVMEEIEEHIRKRYLNDQFNKAVSIKIDESPADIDKFIISTLKDAVYTMPKE